LKDESTRELDSILVKSAKNGDKVALSELVTLYSPRIYNLAMRIMRNEEDAEDVLQETFLKMINKLKTFRGDSAFYTWLYRIGTNVALGKIREKKHIDNFVSVDGPDFENIKGAGLSHWPDHLDDQIEKDYFKECLKKAMNDLPDHYRAVFVLRDLESLSTREASMILDISEANVKIRLMRARLFLRDQLAHHLKCIEVIV
jgi:RNA polymerase sigma-70 factor (ECF subfamily)